MSRYIHSFGIAFLINTFALTNSLGLNAKTATSIQFENDLARVGDEIQDNLVFNSRTCGDYLEANTEFLYKHGFSFYMPNNSDEIGHLKSVAPKILKDMFLLRLSVHEKLKEFSSKQSVTEHCLSNIRRTLRYSRFIEEFISEWYAHSNEVDLPTTAFSGKAPSMFINPRMGQFEFRSGDIILMRSDSFASATIARIGDDDGQFSHAGLVYISENGEPLIIESIVSKGVFIHPLKDITNHPPARILLLRHNNPSIAKNSSEAIYKYIRKEETQRGYIPYDFNLDLNTKETFFCTELVAHAYQLGSQKDVQLPTFPTSMNIFSDHPFLPQMGIHSTVTFAPTDIEIEPQLTLVAEWRDIRLSAKTRQQDAILSSILDWMAKDNYQLNFHSMNRLGSTVAWSLLQPMKLINKRVPANIDRDFLSTVLLLRSIVNSIETSIEQESLHTNESDITVDYAKLLSTIERIRSKDCERHKNYQHWKSNFPLELEDDMAPTRSKFHHLINVPYEYGECNSD